MILLNILAFLLNPVIGLLMSTSYVFMSKKAKVFDFYLFYVSLALFLGFINMTKIPENDLAYHASQYLEAANYSFGDYIAWLGKEVVFYAFNYIFYYLSGGSIKFWILIITFVSYYLLFISIHKFFTKIGQSEYLILFAIIIAAFFPQLFSLSAHLVRQFLAASIFMYFLVEKVFYNKTLWILIVIGIFVHSSCIFFFPLTFLGFLNQRIKRSNIKYFLLLAGGLFFYQLVAKLLMPVASVSVSLKYALDRASQDTKFDLGDFSIVSFAFLFMLLAMLIKVIFFNKSGVKPEGLDHFANILLILMFFIVINVRQSELSNRFFFYVWFFFPFIVPLYVNKKSLTPLRTILSISLIVFFIFRLSNGTWHYDPISSILSTPALNYFVRPEFKLH